MQRMASGISPIGLTAIVPLILTAIAEGDTMNRPIGNNWNGYDRWKEDEGENPRDALGEEEE